MYVLDFLKAICIVLLLLLIGLCLEKAIHMEADISKCVYLLKADICKIIEALFTKEKIRYVIEAGFLDKLRKIAEPFGAVGMDIYVKQIWNAWNAGLYLIALQFVSKTKMDEQELQRITDLLKIAFRRYLDIKGLPWRNFACYESGPDGVVVYLYYEEFPEDRVAFETRYRELVKEKAGLDFGCLRDDDLDKELNSI